MTATPCRLTGAIAGVAHKVELALWEPADEAGEQEPRNMRRRLVAHPVGLIPFRGVIRRPRQEEPRAVSQTGTSRAPTRRPTYVPSDRRYSCGLTGLHRDGDLYQIPSDRGARRPYHRQPGIQGRSGRHGPAETSSTLAPAPKATRGAAKTRDDRKMHGLVSDAGRRAVHW